MRLNGRVEILAYLGWNKWAWMRARERYGSVIRCWDGTGQVWCISEELDEYDRKQCKTLEYTLEHGRVVNPGVSGFPDRAQRVGWRSRRKVRISAPCEASSATPDTTPPVGEGSEEK
jgi:hypothetical protein